MLKCVFSRVLSREIENEDERDRRLFAFFETPTTVALISLIITRVRGRKTARKKTKKPRWSGSNFQWIFALMAFERVDLLLSGKIF